MLTVYFCTDKQTQGEPLNEMHAILRSDFSLNKKSNSGASLFFVYLIKYIWVSWIEKGRDSFLNTSNDLRPNGVHQEVVSWNNVGFITGHTKG